MFVDLVHFLIDNPALDMKTALGEEVSSSLDELWREHGLPEVNVASIAQKYPSPTHDVPEDAVTLPEEPRLRAFSNTVFDKTLEECGIDVEPAGEVESDDEAEAHMNFNTAFQDQQHWHNNKRAILPKHLGGEEKTAPLTEWQKKRQLRSEQRFTAKLQWQAESLTGAFGKALEQITILSAAGRTPATGHPKVSCKLIDMLRNTKPCAKQDDTNGAKNKPEKPGKKGKKPHVSKADQIRMEHAAKKSTSKDESNEIWWKEQLQLVSLKPTAERAPLVDRLLDNATRSEKGWLAVEMRLFRLHLEFGRWIDHPDADSDDEAKQAAIRDEFTVSTMRMIKDICERGGIFPAARKHLTSALQALGFADYAASLLNDSPAPSEDDRKLAFSFVKLMRSKTKAPTYDFMTVTEDPIVWQLRLFGEYMDRSMDSQPDRRVSFKPDAWQRQVLDCLDDVDQQNNMNHSVLVVGKSSL